MVGSFVGIISNCRVLIMAEVVVAESVKELYGCNNLTDNSLIIC